MKTKPTQETGLSAEGIGVAIKEGAITKQYLADPKTIVNAFESFGEWGGCRGLS